MTYNRKFLLSFLVLGLFLSACTQTPEQREKNGTVLIIAAKADGTIGSGSGFFVQPDKIATNIHVIAGDRMIFAVGTKKVHNIEKVVGYNPERDLVVLEVSGEGEPLEPGEGQKGESILVVGYPGGGYKVTEGKVHSIRNSDKQLRLVIKGFPEIGGSVSAPGNSGGPILNGEGKVIGIAVSGEKVLNFSYAITSSTLNTLLKSTEEENLADWQKRKSILAYTYYAWGYEKLESENHNEAIKGFDKAIAEYKEYAEAYVERGTAKTNLSESKASLGDLESARKLYQEGIQDYDKAIGLIPDDVSAYYNRGNAKLKNRDYVEAIHDFDKALKLNQDYAESYRNRGNAKSEMSDPDYAGAIKDYTDAINLKTRGAERAEYYLNRGNAKLKSKDYVGAIEDYTKAISAIENYDKNETIRLKDNLARAYLGRGGAKQSKKRDPDYAGAIEDYKKVIALNPEDYGAYQNRSVAKKALGQDEDAKQDHAKAHYYWGKAYLNSRNYQAAIEKFDEAIDLDPSYVEAYHYRSDVYRLRGEKEDFQQAIADYDKVVALKPDYTEIHVVYNNRGLAKVAVANYDGAISDYTKAIGLKSNYAEAHYNRGDAYRLRGQKYFQNAVENFQEAEKNYTKAIELRDFDFPDAYHKRGLVKKETLGQDAAKQDFATAYYLWGLEAHEGEQYQKAIKNFDECLDLEPDFVYYKNLELDPDFVYYDRGSTKGALGKSKADLGDLEDALQFYQASIDDHDKAIKMVGKVALFYKYRGETKVLRAAIRDVPHNDHNRMIEDYESAIEDFEEALERKSGLTAFTYHHSGMARCLLGYAKANQGNAKEARKQYNLALEDFKEAIKLDKKNAVYYKGLGLANAALGKAKEALSAFEEAKRLETESENK